MSVMTWQIETVFIAVKRSLNLSCCQGISEPGREPGLHSRYDVD